MHTGCGAPFCRTLKDVISHIRTGTACIQLFRSTTHWLLTFILCLPSFSVHACLLGDRVVEGVVVGLPTYSPSYQKFRFAAEYAGEITATSLVPCQGLLRVAWYRPTVRVRPGERWRFTLRSRVPRGFANPDAFDYPLWLEQQGVTASGYIRDKPVAVRLASGDTSLDQIRDLLGERIVSIQPDRPALSLLAGLAVGDRRTVSPQQWRTLSRTGTSHLMAISGLHIALVAGAVYWAVGWVWRHCRFCVTRLATPWVAGVLAWLAALIYAGLAGFAVPTQRALLMFALVLFLPLLGRPLSPGWILLGVASVLVLLDGQVLTQAGFWLSFCAVGLILFTFAGRGSPSNSWWRYGRIHLLLAVGLAPLLGLFFHQIPLLSPLANFIAVPWMGVLVIPLTLSGTLFLYIGSDWGEWLLLRAADLLDMLWWLLQAIADSGEPLVVALATPLTQFFALLAVIWLLGPWPLRLKIIAPLLLLPLLLARPPAPNAGGVRVTVLDVGQALAVVVRTSEHTLVYDTGLAYSPRFETGGGIIAPYLRRLGVSRVDTLVVSHAGADHSGGVAGLLSAMPVGRKLTSAPDADRLHQFEPCRAGDTWWWEGVGFRLLHPSDTDTSRGDNDGSCVLQIVSGAGEGLLLLTGDLEEAGERRLLQRYPQSLQSGWLQVPHHGSRTSSHERFVALVQPRLALISSGYHNRYRFPHEEVVERYVAIGAEIMNTAYLGAITLEYTPDEGFLTPLVQRVSD